MSDSIDRDVPRGSSEVLRPPEQSAERHVAIVSNAGPGVLGLVSDEEGNVKPDFKFKAGGVAAVLLPAANDLAKTSDSVTWYYAEPTELGKRYQGQRFAHDNFLVAPVFIPPEVYDPYYNQIANARDWFMHHGNGHELTLEDQRQFWDAKVAANRVFAEAVATTLPRNAKVFGNDYQPDLALGMLADMRPDLEVVGFFHIPFARPEEMARAMPASQARYTMSMMSKVSWVFQTAESERHYRECVERFARPTERSIGIVTGVDTPVRARTSPVVIDWEGVHQRAASPAVGHEMDRMRAQIGDRSRPVIVEVARTDETKCILETLKAYELVVKSPRVEPKPVLLLVSNSTRLDSPRYAAYRERVVNRVEEINATIPGANIVLQPDQSSFDTTLAAFRLGDVFSHGARRAGYEVVAVEFCAAKQWGDKLGTVVVFEGIGAAATMAGVRAEQTRLLDAVGKPTFDEDGRAQQLIEGFGEVPAAYVVRGAGPEVDDGKAVRLYAQQLLQAVVLSGEARELRALATYAAARPQNGSVFTSTVMDSAYSVNHPDRPSRIIQEGYLVDAASTDPTGHRSADHRGAVPARGGAGNAGGGFHLG